MRRNGHDGVMPESNFLEVHSEKKFGNDKNQVPKSRLLGFAQVKLQGILRQLRVYHSKR